MVPQALRSRAPLIVGATSIAVIVFATTWPWTDFVGHPHWEKVRWTPFTEWRLKWWEVVANVVLFVPLGWAVARQCAGSIVRRLLLAWAVAFCLSCSVETYQIYAHSRLPTATDVVMNTCGALLGALLTLGGRKPGDETVPVTTRRDPGPVLRDS